MREATALVVEGLRARARLAAAEGPARIWADGLQLGALLIMLVGLGQLYLVTPMWIWSIAPLAATLALLRGRPRLALAAMVLVVLAEAGSFWEARPGWVAWGRTGADWSLLDELLVVGLLGALSFPALRSRVRRRSLAWLLVPAVQLAGALIALLTFRPDAPVDGPVLLIAEAAMLVSGYGPGLLMVGAALTLAVVAWDPRPAIAAPALLPAFVAPFLPLGWPVAPGMDTGSLLLALAYPLLLAGVTPLLVWAAVHAAREQRRRL
jgi:hypothetical protein